MTAHEMSQKNYRQLFDSAAAPFGPTKRVIVDQGWQEHRGTVYRCPVYLIREAAGTYSAIAARLPEIVSHGNTEQEALEKIKEALAAALSPYKEKGAGIPWLGMPRELPPGAKERSVIVRLKVV